jgi:CheY-like chemotaxis protein
MESIGNLAGGVAHDFNNLLSAVKMLTAVLLRDEPDAGKVSYLREIDRATDSAAELTRALLGFARRGKHLSAPVPLNEIVLRMARLMQRTLDRRIKVETDVGARTGIVMGDASQLEQVVMNLLVNARDAMPAGGTVVLRTRDAEGGKGVVLEIEDSGTGIDPAVRPHIFEPYFTTKHAGEASGTGLGLATVWGIVESHAATIAVHDAEPHGTRVRVVFPAVALAQREGTHASERPRLTEGRGTLLVVDDERGVRESAARALEMLGYDVLRADGGDAALAVLREREVAAVLLDFSMPGKGGRETYVAMRELRADLPVLLMTGYALNEEIQRVLDLGARGFLAKPFTLEQLSVEVERLIGR